MRFFFGWNLSVHQYLLIILKWVWNPKYLTPVLLFTAVVTVTGLGITFFYMLQDLPHTSVVRDFGTW
jgi:proton-coupled amino acid transporter